MVNLTSHPNVNGQGSVLTCSTELPSVVNTPVEVTISWSKNDVFVLSNNTNSSQLIIEEFADGVYTCTVRVAPINNSVFVLPAVGMSNITVTFKGIYKTTIGN